jgi:chromosome segregation ATPase
LNDVYSVASVPERIQSLRNRYLQIQDSLEHYETKVERQTRELERMHRGDGWEENEEEGDAECGDEDEESELEITEEDLRKEEEEIMELERKKRELEERVSGMERDLGGLLR